MFVGFVLVAVLVFGEAEDTPKAAELYAHFLASVEARALNDTWVSGL